VYKATDKPGLNPDIIIKEEQVGCSQIVDCHLSGGIPPACDSQVLGVVMGESPEDIPLEQLLPSHHAIRYPIPVPREGNINFFCQVRQAFQRFRLLVVC
jgi:hypothetical protein